MPVTTVMVKLREIKATTIVGIVIITNDKLIVKPKPCDGCFIIASTTNAVNSVIGI